MFYFAQFHLDFPFLCLGVTSLDHDRTYYITLVAVNRLELQSVGATSTLYIDTTPPKV